MSEIWNGLIGQDSVRHTLSLLIKNKKIPNALIFKGPDGVGKDFFAIRFANIINALNPDSSLDIDYNTLKNNIGEPAVKFIFPLPVGKNETSDDGPFDKLTSSENELIQKELQQKVKNPYHKIEIPKANQIKINSIRDINKFLSLNYLDIPYRTIIISDADKISEIAQNALLKNLEEPPEGVVFILTTSNIDNLRETIRSRCWTVNFEPLENSDLITVLEQYFVINTEEAAEAAPFANGSVSSALHLLGKNISAIKENTILILRFAMGKKYHSALEVINGLVKEHNKEILPNVLQAIMLWMSDAEKFKSGSGNYFFNEHKETFEKFCSKYPHIQFHEVSANLEFLINKMQNNNVNQNIVITNIVTALASIISD